MTCARAPRGSSSKDPRALLFYPRAPRGSRAQLSVLRAGRDLLKLDAVPSQRKPPRAHRALICRFFLIFAKQFLSEGVEEVGERRYLNATSWRRADAAGELHTYVNEHWELSAPRELTRDEFNRHLQALVTARTIGCPVPGMKVERSNARPGRRLHSPLGREPQRAARAREGGRP